MRSALAKYQNQTVPFTSMLNVRSARYIAAVAFLLIVFALGGGSRGDIQSLALLRPLATIFLFGSIVAWPLQPGQRHPVLFGIAIAIVVLAALHAIPLPPAVWTLLPGRELIERIDEAAGLGDLWRPLSLVPQSAWNALFSLVVPLAALALAVRLTVHEHVRIVRIFIFIGLVSVVIGIAQLLGGAGGPLYFYRITNAEALVGLFSNRNHHAIFLACLLPALGFLLGLPAVNLSRFRLRIAAVLLIGMFLLIALVIVGSRTGLVVGLAGILAAVVLVRYPVITARTHRHDVVKKTPNLRWWKVAAGSATASAAVLFVAFGDSAVVDRLVDSGGVDEVRFYVWKPIAELSVAHLPFGSGNGSFVEVYMAAEPTDLLQFVYLNHAHNDWLEVVMTTGVPGALLLILATIAWTGASWTVFARRDGAAERVALARLGSAILAMLALASIADYPLRTPSLACLFVFAAVWLSLGSAKAEVRGRDA